MYRLDNIDFLFMKMLRQYVVEEIDLNEAPNAANHGEPDSPADEIEMATTRRTVAMKRQQFV